MSNKYRGVPDKWRREGILVYALRTAKVGDTVEAIRDAQGSIENAVKGTSYTISKIIIEPRGEQRGFSKRIELEELSGDFNPKRFR